MSVAEAVWASAFGTAFAMWTNHGTKSEEDVERARAHAKEVADRAVVESQKEKS